MAKQMKFGFNQKLGKVISSRKALLYGDVLFSLNPKQYYLDYDNPDEQPVEGVICSFCFNGNLQLTKVIPMVEESRHWGNGYVYNCIFCQAAFLGTITWE